MEQSELMSVQGGLLVPSIPPRTNKSWPGLVCFWMKMTVRLAPGPSVGSGVVGRVEPGVPTLPPPDEQSVHTAKIGSS